MAFIITTNSTNKFGTSWVASLDGKAKLIVKGTLYLLLPRASIKLRDRLGTHRCKKREYQTNDVCSPIVFDDTDVEREPNHEDVTAEPTKEDWEEVHLLADLRD